jgi:polar amino acid transport system substrate-binding protein
LTDLRKLVNGRVAAVAALELTADALISTNPEFSKIVKMTLPITTKDYYLIFSRQFNQRHPEMVTKVWDAIRQYRQEYRSMALKYF